MNDTRQLGGAVAAARRPRAVFVGGAGRGRLADRFRKLGWEVTAVPAGDGLACAVLARKPSVVVLPVETDWESGYLVAAKLRAARRKVRVILVAPARTAEAERLARFVGATLVVSGAAD